MTFDELMAYAFRQGCGISLEYARRTLRYHQLLAEAQELNLPDPESSALVETLGERLADRAFQNLPSHIRVLAERWHEGLDLQKQILAHIATELRTGNWRRKGERENYEYNSDPRCVLPHSAKSWARGQFMPNCLAVAQMLVGFAREAGAEHFLANVVRLFEQEMVRWEVRSLKAALDLLESTDVTNREMRRITGNLRKSYETALINADALHNIDAHHVLVVRLADGSWWVLDPYQCTTYPLGDDPQRDAALPQIRQRRNKTLLLDYPHEAPAYTYKLGRQLETLRFMLMVIKGRFHVDPGEDPIKDPILMGLARAAAYVSSQEFTDHDDEFFDKLIQIAEAPQDLSDPEDKLAQLTSLALMQALVPELEEGKLADRLKRALRDETTHQRVAWRIVAFHLQSFAKALDALYSDMAARKHECLEVAWPGLMLGVATLNHLRAHMPVRLGGLLSVLSSSQWVLADTLAAERNGDTIDDAHRERIAERLATLSGFAAKAIVPPLQYLKFNTTEEHHG